MTPEPQMTVLAPDVDRQTAARKGPSGTISTRDTPRPPVRITGVGMALPARGVTNREMAARLDTSDAWIVGRTGIRSRRVAGAGETTTALGSAAAQQAMEAAGVPPSAIDLILVATATPDSACPSTAARIGAELGLRAGGFDVNGACCGFVHAFTTAAALVAETSVSTALVIGVDRFSTLTDPQDRSTSILFGDGAGALVMARGAPRPGAPGILGTDLGGDPTGLDLIEVPLDSPYLSMDGPELFRRATRGLTASASAALGRAGASPSDVDLFIPHQANARIIGAAAERIGIPHERVVLDLAERANTSAASIPLALHGAIRDGRLADGDRILISAIGAGLAWASVYLRWGS